MNFTYRVCVGMIMGSVKLQGSWYKEGGGLSWGFQCILLWSMNSYGIQWVPKCQLSLLMSPSWSWIILQWLKCIVISRKSTRALVRVCSHFNNWTMKLFITKKWFVQFKVSSLSNCDNYMWKTVSNVLYKFRYAVFFLSCILYFISFC